MKVEPITLNGKRVLLEPLAASHIDELTAVGSEPAIWTYSVEQVTDRAAMERYVEQALADRAAGRAVPFVTRLVGSNEVVGSTRFGNIDPPNRRAEIGWTWIAAQWQRSFVNTEAKFLMLTHAFEVWKCIRVEFKTDAINDRSRNAILRLGATEEGILRQHMITDSGRFRDSVYFSILDKEWNSVKAGLVEKLSKQ